MGNEQSQIPGIEIDQRVVEVSDYWAQHTATINNLENVSKLSIFAGDLFLNEPFWAPKTPLEKFSKNLMIYRHPCIIKYISSWQKACKFYLAVEEVTPLSHVIAQMNTMEICLGLYSILKALYFLHGNASGSHNNVCLASIFISKEGSWKLGGMEYLCGYGDLSAEYLKKSRNHRYRKAVDTNEDKNLKHSFERKDFIDVFAFCTLAIELLRNRNNEEIPHLSSFKDFCTQVVQEPNALQRPKIHALLDHNFFKNNFISIHSYLIELPLKSDADKTEFFTHLKEELEKFDEEIVASQLGGLLVSRMVLLNAAARNCLLPYVLIPRKGENGALFSEMVYKKHIASNLLRIFCVRDAQIRLLLLEYFPHFMCCFSREELQSHILPELLVGIKDTNGDLVSATLHTLAELVPVLGADVVIGGKRAKLFNDGQPKIHTSSRKSSKTTKQKREISISDEASSTELVQNQAELPERPRPDGEENETSTEEIEPSADGDVDNWEDWDNEVDSDHRGQQQNDEDNIEAPLPPNAQVLATKSALKPRKLLDITELDIKNQAKIELEQNEVDFFEDMEPVIQSSNKFLIEEPSEDISESGGASVVSSKLFVRTEEDASAEEGWGDDWE